MNDSETAVDVSVAFIVLDVVIVGAGNADAALEGQAGSFYHCGEGRIWNYLIQSYYE